MQAYDGVLVPVNDFEGKVDADGGPVVLREELVNVAFDDGCLARTQLSDDQHFVQMFVLGVAVAVVGALFFCFFFKWKHSMTIRNMKFVLKKEAPIQTGTNLRCYNHLNWIDKNEKWIKELMK